MTERTPEHKKGWYAVLDGDARPEPGWYWATTPYGIGVPIEYRVAHRPDIKPLWLLHDALAARTEFPLGWTLGPKIDDLLRDAARYRWQPIGTAPKDGSRVRLFIPYLAEAWECENTGVWKQDEGKCGCWRFEGDDGPDDMQPTHWMPLSEPPSRAEIDDEIARDAALMREKTDG